MVPKKQAVWTHVAGYNDQRLVDCVNSELANTLGNLLSRCAANSLNRDQAIPAWHPGVFADRCTKEDREMWGSLASLPGTVAFPVSLALVCDIGCYVSSLCE